MRIILQRVSSASVTVADDVVGAIGYGLLALVGIAHDDTEATVERAADKTLGLRIFCDEHGRFDRSLKDIAGSVLVVSQFTLLADTQKGNRPSFTAAAAPEHAAPLVAHYAETLRQRGIDVATGRFGADMQIALTNDGPVTIVLDSTR